MPVTLADLRALTERALTHTENPAILRLPERERTVEGLDHAHQPRILSFMRPNGFREKPDWMNGNSAWQIGGEGWTLDLTDPGTAHALLVALALGMGLDPGVGGLEVTWSRRDNGGYILCSRSGNRTFDFTEPDPIRALELAVRHVLEGP